MQSVKNVQLFAQRVLGCRTSRGLTQTQLAHGLGVSLRSVQLWEGADNLPGPNKLRKLADYFGVTIAYLLGVEEKAAAMVTGENPPPLYKGNVERIAPLADLMPRMIPVVSWAAAGAGGNFSDLEEQIEERIPSDVRDPNAYALIIQGDSMIPDFQPGDRVIFRPNDSARNGDVVVARIKKTGEVYFKVFHMTGPHGETVRLTSYNGAVYPPMEYHLSEFRFIHPMYSMMRMRR